jgi:hypothetical protein
MRIAILLLSIAGFAAVALRAGIALVDALRGGVDSVLARDLADIRARRGDLTGLQDAADVRAAARRERMIAVTAFLMYIGLLAVPPLTPWPNLLYSAYALLWLVPRRKPGARAP